MTVIVFTKMCSLFQHSLSLSLQCFFRYDGGCVCLQANGKLFIFDVESQAWLERGSGNMRLNDISHRLSNCSTFRSRLGESVF